MIYIATADNEGFAVYFDIHSTESHGRDLKISGTIGDGLYEGEVLVETGRTSEVTFADAWLGGEGFREFLGRCGADRLEKALLESVRGGLSRGPRRSRPRGGAASRTGRVSERGPVWRSRV